MQRLKVTWHKLLSDALSGANPVKEEHGKFTRIEKDGKFRILEGISSAGIIEILDVAGEFLAERK